MNEFTVGLLTILAFGVGLYAYAHFFLLRDRQKSGHGNRGR
ncbi:hypothetical protein [Rhodovibrio sodomensis]|nr:hypothetical protein [Rhodovibrio sodomensis]